MKVTEEILNEKLHFLCSVNRLSHSSPMNSTVTNKIRHFPQLFVLGPQIALKARLYYFLFWSIITTKLDIYVYQYKDDYIRKGLLQAIFLVPINISLSFLPTCLHQILMPSFFHAFISSFIYLRELLRQKRLQLIFVCRITLNL